jgi:4a-hydroxytetrahydrobiopterin dehydratase
MKKYTDQELETKLADYPAWVMDEESGKLVAGFEFDNFTQALDFLNALADVAEEMDHHPDLLLHDERFVTIFTATNSVKGITIKDFDLIDKIEEELVD